MKKKATRIIGILLIVIAVISSFMFMKLSHSYVSIEDANGIKWNFTISGSNATNVYYSSGTLTEKLEIPSILTYGSKTYK